MAGWTVDQGLLRLRAQVDARAPGRSKASDGTIGDAAHAATESDHNPEHPPPAGNPDYQVDALDLTHDPAHGADMAAISEAIRVSRDRRVSYVIFNRRIYSGAGGPQPWVWRPYTGASPHTEHMHVSVRDDHHDETQDWQIGANMALPSIDDVIRYEIRAWLADTLTTTKRIETKLDAVTIAIGAIGSSNPDVVAILAGLDDRLGALKAELRDAVADLGEGGAAQVRADAGP
jgi:Arc/MetJ-type ribon-helix-helix transcriptional regulator